MGIEVQVSAARCIASKACVNAAEGVFEIAGGVARVMDPEAAPLDDVLEAADLCPTGAITIRKDGQPL